MLAVFAFFLKRKNSISPLFKQYLNLSFLIFLAIDAGVLVKKIFIVSQPEKHRIANQDEILKTSPDIYFIVADEYAGNKGLINICKYDNTFFLNKLRQRGFFVADSSSANYNSTPFSMASVLNMNYLDMTDEQLERGDHTEALKSIFENEVVAFLKQLGYSIHNYSIFDLKEQFAENKNAFVPSRTALFTSQTFFDRFKKDVWINALRMAGLKGILRNYLFENLRYNQKTFQETIDLTRLEEKKPKFVYTHLEMPHFQYYYDADGKLYPDSVLWNEQPGNTKTYVEYLQYTNKQLLKLIDEILRNNKSIPVIVLISDHGYRSFPKGTISHAFSNLFSVYLPDKNYKHFNDSISNVNVFRALFNTLFDQQFSMLENKTINVGN